MELTDSDVVYCKFFKCIMHFPYYTHNYLRSGMALKKSATVLLLSQHLVNLMWAVLC